MPDIYKQTTIEEIILTAFAIVIIFLFLGCLSSFFRGIFFFIFWWGKEDQKKKWRNSIRFMIIWLIISIWLLIAFPYAIRASGIQSSSGIESKDVYSTKKVFAKAWELFKKMFELWTIIKASQKSNETSWRLFYDINWSTNPNTTTSTNSNYDL